MCSSPITFQHVHGDVVGGIDDVIDRLHLAHAVLGHAGRILAPSLFNTCMDWVLGKVADQSHCGASFGNSKVADLVYADDAVIVAELLEVLVMALEVLHARWWRSVAYLMGKLSP